MAAQQACGYYLVDGSNTHALYLVVYHIAELSMALEIVVNAFKAQNCHFILACYYILMGDGKICTKWGARQPDKRREITPTYTDNCDQVVDLIFHPVLVPTSRLETALEAFCELHAAHSFSVCNPKMQRFGLQ